ncbi:MAG: KH domain-containing protein [Bacilli bacterium]|nr:KH domain-containing protein [Bacilli bacterium]
MKKYNFEGKNIEELTLQALKELNVKEDEMITDVKEETVGLLKKKKYNLNVVLKSDVIDFSKEFVKNVVKGMGLEDIILETQRTENYIKITMHSENSSILIGKNGRTLSSIQTLLRAAIYRQTNMHINVVLDVENYKERQEHNIERLAKKLAKEVLKTKEPITMDSMNSYERRLVHSALADFKNISTESEGEEPNRKVVIKYIER